MFYTYILECSDDTFYTGYTNDIEKRLKAHNDGNGAKYTKSRRPVKIVYYEQYESKIDAQKREFAIKRMNRKKKIMLCVSFNGI
jgi:putative endonuclease